MENVKKACKILSLQNDKAKGHSQHNSGQAAEVSSQGTDDTMTTADEGKDEKKKGLYI